MPQKTSHDDLLAVATTTFRENGFHDTRVSEIVAAAGVSQGTFYLYFPSKRQAFLEIIGALAAEIRTTAGSVDWSEMSSVEDFRSQFATLYGGVFELVADRRNAATLLLVHAPVVGDDAARIRRRLVDEMEAITSQYTAEGIRRGFLRPLDVAVVSRAVIGLLLHTITRTILEEGRTGKLHELADELLDFELYGAVGDE
jgi:AcrR family transcriptional regulator